MSLAFVFSSLDRRANQRRDAAWLAQERARPSARVVELAGDKVRLHQGALAASVAPPVAADEVFLGVDDQGAPWFARELAPAPPAEDSRPREDLRDLRSLAVSGALDAAALGRAAQARSLLHWHARHRHCAVCGGATVMVEAGYRRHCAACGADHFPRTDPVAIAVVRHQGRILLGRQRPWPPGMYSALAGFVEPGETLEDAVRREVQEESGVRVGALTYVASQPWPFPASLMLGFVGEATTAELAIDYAELEDARWFSADEARQMVTRTHPSGLWAAHPIALAHRLVRAALGMPLEEPGEGTRAGARGAAGGGDAPSSSPSPQFAVMRQDDNGQRAELGRYPSRAEAEAVARGYEARGHKQLYWVEPAPR